MGGDACGPSPEHLILEYATTHAKYKYLLQHLGGLEPGGEKSVPEMPDPWDEWRVKAAAHAYAAKLGWPHYSYRVVITKTDADGKADVSLTRSPAPHAGPTEYLFLRVDPKTYEAAQTKPTVWR